MVPDIQTKSQPKVNNDVTQNNPQNYKDITKPIATNIQLESDEAIKAVYANLDQLKALSVQAKDIISIGTQFNTNVGKIVQLDAVNVINKILPILTTDNINKINSVSNNIQSIISLNEIDEQIKQLVEVKEQIKQLDLIKADINDVSLLEEEIQIVNDLSEQIQLTSQNSTQLISIYKELDKLISIFNYLAELIRLSEFLEKIEVFRKDNNITLLDIVNRLGQLVNHLGSIEHVSKYIDDLLELDKLIEEFPQIYDNVKDKLNHLELEFDTQLKDKHNELKKDLEQYVYDFKLDNKKFKSELLEHVNKIKEYDLDMKEIKLSYKLLKQDITNTLNEINEKNKLEQQRKDEEFKNYIYNITTKWDNEIDNVRLQYTKEINNYRNELDKLIKHYKDSTLEYTKFKDNLDNYAKGKLLDTYNILGEKLDKEILDNKIRDIQLEDYRHKNKVDMIHMNHDIKESINGLEYNISKEIEQINNILNDYEQALIKLDDRTTYDNINTSELDDLANSLVIDEDGKQVNQLDMLRDHIRKAKEYKSNLEMQLQYLKTSVDGLLDDVNSLEKKKDLQIKELENSIKTLDQRTTIN